MKNVFNTWWKLNSLLFHNSIKPSFRAFVFTFGSKPTPMCLLGVCIQVLGSADGCGAVPKHTTRTGCTFLASSPCPPSLFRFVSSATQRIWITAEIPSMHLEITRVYCRSTPLSFTTWFQPPTLPSVRIYLFESQANKAHLQSAGSSSCSPGTPTLPIYSIWC